MIFFNTDILTDYDRQWLLVSEKDRGYETITDDLWWGILMEILLAIRETDLNIWHLIQTNGDDGGLPFMTM